MSTSITSEKRDLLRIFRYIDDLPPYQSTEQRRLNMNDVVIDGKTAHELNPQIIAISDSGAFRCDPNNPFVVNGEAFLIIRMDGAVTARWRADVGAVQSNT